MLKLYIFSFINIIYIFVVIDFCFISPVQVRTALIPFVLPMFYGSYFGRNLAFFIFNLHLKIVFLTKVF